MGAEGIGGMAGGLVGTAFGGPVGGMIGGMAGNMLDGLFGGGGQKGGVEGLTGLLGAGGLPQGGLGGGIQPELASKALQMFDQATSPDQKMKLLDIAIYALGGKPGEMPGGMNGAGGGGASPTASNAGTGAGGGAGGANGAGSADGAASHKAHKHHKHHHHHHDAAESKAPGPNTGGSNGTGSASARSANASPSTSGTGSTSGSPSNGNGGLSVNGNTVDTGRYQISASTDKDGQVKILDKQTNTYVEAFGDPHLATSDGDKAQFQKNGLSIKLPDGTQVHLKPTATNDKGVSWLDSAMVEKNGQAVTMSGMHGGDGQVHTSQVQDATSDLESEYVGQGQTVLDASSKDVGDLFFTDANGNRTTELVSPDKEQSLDGKGGSLAKSGAGETGGTSGNGTSGPTGCQFGYNSAMLDKMGQVLHLAAANVPNQGARADVLSGVQAALGTMIHPQGIN